MNKPTTSPTRQKLGIFGLLLCSAVSTLTAQENYRQVVQSDVSGAKVLLELNLPNLQQSLDTLFANLSSAPSSTSATTDWADVLSNGSNPGMNVNFGSYDITELGGLTATGTLAADSLTLNKDAVISGILTADRIAVSSVINGQVASLVNHTTDDLPEGSSNLYLDPSEREAFVIMMHAVDSLSCTWMKHQGYVYELVLIGDQCWFAENLRAADYANGEEIPLLSDPSAWEGASEGARSVYNNDDANLSTFGYMYNWYTVQDERQLCPSGWHVPTYNDWTTLIGHVGDNGHSGAESTALKATTTWSSAPGTDDFNFSALAVGSRGKTGVYGFQGTTVMFWAYSPNNVTSLYWRMYSESTVSQNTGDPRPGFSVRCLRD